MRKAVTCFLKTNFHDHTFYKTQLNELKKLVQSLNYQVINSFTQTRKSPKSSTLFGKGKVKELRNYVEKNQVELVVFYNLLTSKQKYNLEVEIGKEVIDRYELTLRIFNKMASDRLSKLQIELASIKKLFPYYKLKASQKYFKERPGYMGGGEYIYHNVLSGLRKLENKITKEIEAHKERKKERILKRKRKGTKIVCLVGYYNAGKTSIFNAITKCNKQVSDFPFTTIASKYSMRYSKGESFLIVDTIGFVLDIDPQLISSFEINLLDMQHADLLLHVIDVTDNFETIKLKYETTNRILDEIGLKERSQIYVLNKIDLLPQELIEERTKKLKKLIKGRIYAVSALKRKNLQELIEGIMQVLYRKRKEKPLAVVAKNFRNQPV